MYPYFYLTQNRVDNDFVGFQHKNCPAVSIVGGCAFGLFRQKHTVFDTAHLLFKKTLDSIVTPPPFRADDPLKHTAPPPSPPATFPSNQLDLITASFASPSTSKAPPENPESTNGKDKTKKHSENSLLLLKRERTIDKTILF
jgi:hypothetical protein